MKLIFTFILCIFFSISGYCQAYDSLYFGAPIISDLPTELVVKVHSLDDFMDRFNGLHNAFGIPIDQTSITFQKIKQNPMYWIEYRKRVIETFVSDSLRTCDTKAEVFSLALAKSEELDFYKTNWFVSIPFRTMISCPEQRGIVRLKINTIKDESRWIIDSVIYETDTIMNELIEFTPEFCEDIFIPPSAHDNGFIAFYRIIKNKQDLKRHMIRNSDDLARFIKMVEVEDLKFYRNQLRYHFMVSDSLSFVTDKSFHIINFNF